ncbi:energy transducer TonB [Edaphobacter modestus]|uniref:Outer membrane transport energization protein TonB n=1 Tax=Edaphobacter modestus TaxID=388466 RepID=A0A4Q7YRV6_9BACT|nr:energy transducer TonB [Edaphobacter modestus]RZU39653.1 outer membrane transport energization protein TonB [Edaphobacter modestus]
MFEASLVASQITPVSATRRWTTAGSIALQVSLAAVLVALPLLHPERLSLHVETPLVFTPPPPHPPLPQAQTHSAGPQNAPLPSIPVTMRPLVPSFGHPSPDTGTPWIGPTLPPGMGETLPGALTSVGNGSGPAVTVAIARPPKTVHISEGVSAGLLIAPIRPVYPAIARAAGVSGKVVIEAVISKNGTIESLHVVSGPEMLKSAAIDAIRTARYQPFRLNGEPVEVQTTITVNFTMGR